MEIKNHNDAELEAISVAFLKHWGAGKLDNRSLRIESLIQAFGYYVWPVPGLSKIAEAYIPALPGYIFVDEDQYLNRNFRIRFTLAEELAHIILHRPLFDGKGPAEIIKMQEEITDEQYLIIEWNAKFLAGALLMPREIFLTRFIHFHRQQSARISNELQVLKYVIRQLSMDFYVSCYATGVRARRLKLIDQQQLDDLTDLNPNW